jgi:hypothetical protein
MELGTKLTLVFSLNAEKIQAQGIVTTRFPQVGNQKAENGDDRPS